MIICDIDWTIADCTHRKKFLKKEIVDIERCGSCPSLKKSKCDFNGDCKNAIISQESWDEFFREDRVLQDSTIPYSREVLLLLAMKQTVVYYTGRFERLRRTTETWLSRHEYPYHQRMCLRKDTDLRTGLETKKEHLIRILKGTPRDDISIIDDDARLQDWSRKMGLSFFLVSNDFWRRIYELRSLFK